MGDSQLGVNQLLGEYKCNSQILEEYLREAKGLLQQFVDVIIVHIPRTCNEIANSLAHHASGYKLMTSKINKLE